MIIKNEKTLTKNDGLDLQEPFECFYIPHE